MRNGNERKSPFSTSPLHCLNMQPTALSSCDGGGGGGGPFFTNIYELGNGALLHRSLDASSSRPSGLMAACGNGKAIFTSSQLQELERQKIIHKYISASIPVPPQLLFSPSLSQCNSKYSSSATNGNGSDPEPWRCKRTDGKKWRCSRDVAPDQKYCDRHAHKNRPRSRKHVEISPKSSSTPLPRSSSSSPQFPYQQSRCIDWLMRGGSGNSNRNRNRNGDGRAQLEEQVIPSVYLPQFAEKNEFDHGMSSEGSRAAATRLFIDAWGKEGMSMNGGAEKKAWPSSSLSLRMGDDDKGEFKNQRWPSNPISWLSSSSPSPAPGGPLGEALCLGNGGSSLVSSPHGQSHSRSHSHGYGNSNTNSSSKSSCEDGSHALNFIG